jgi:hypothetical protein
MSFITQLAAMCLIAFCGIAPGGGAQAFDFSTVDASTVGFATFNSNTQKIARNRHGMMLAYTKGQNASYTSNDIRFVHVAPTGAQTEVLAQTFATNPPCIEASDTGEFFAAFPDWVNNVLRVYIWRDISVSMQHETHVFSMPGSGKFSCVFDEARRTLYYVGLGGNFVKFRADNGVFISQQLWVDGENAVQYPSLHLSRDGVLHAFWVTITGNNSHYRSVQYMASPNDGIDWFTTWHLRFSGTALALPVVPDESGPTTMLSRSEDIGANTYMESSLADDDSFQAIWFYVPGFAERCFPVEKRCSAVYVKYSRLTGQRVAQHVPVISGGGAVIRPKGGSGLVRRGGQVYYLTLDKTDLVLLKAGDFGMTEVRRTPVPGAGPSNCAYALGTAKGRETDIDILGTLTVLDVSCADWATYTGSVPLTGRVLRVRAAL